ncbi:hypothetical protein BpHYR1_043044 [Brachionus plicatilis]|uniref:Uncharacterized protein n=1 Tax=Brachionus plicatilis TaxID=10195 RepID=A0A3M7T8Y3_BRAPC|nr:hypothetical protein BpHYR1_043044 [Brachionus plicatilis]
MQKCSVEARGAQPRLRIRVGFRCGLLRVPKYLFPVTTEMLKESLNRPGENIVH